MPEVTARAYRVHNSGSPVRPDRAAFCRWDSEDYTIPEGKSAILTAEVANHMHKYNPHVTLTPVEATFEEPRPAPALTLECPFCEGATFDNQKDFKEHVAACAQTAKPEAKPAPARAGR